MCGVGENSHTADGDITWYSLCGIAKVKDVHTLYLNNATPTYIPKRHSQGYTESCTDNGHSSFFVVFKGGGALTQVHEQENE